MVGAGGAVGGGIHANGAAGKAAGYLGAQKAQGNILGNAGWGQKCRGTLPDAIAQLLNEGKIQLFCADSVDGEGVMNGDLPLRRRAEAQEKYFVYLTAELAPRILTLNKAEKGTKIWCAGVDLGAYQAVNCRLRRPNLFAGAVGMGGIYDLSRFWGVENDDLVLRCSPLLYLQENGIANKLALVKAEENNLILCAGQGAYEDDAKADTQALADVLQAQGLPAHLEVWGGDVIFSTNCGFHPFTVI